MTATSSPRHEERDLTAGLGLFVGELLLTCLLDFNLHHLLPLSILWLMQMIERMQSYEFV
jgi:hypothetical protein